MSLWNTVEFAHVPLGLVPEVLDPVDVILLVCKEAGMVVVCKEAGMVDPKVMEIRDVQHVVAAPAIRINDAVRNHFTFDDWQQGR